MTLIEPFIIQREPVTGTLRVGGVPEHFNLPWHWGVTRGTFASAGLNLQFTEYPTGTGAMCTALRSGELDVAVVLTEGIVADILQHKGSRLLAAYVDSPLCWGIFTGSASACAQLSQLDHGTLAISRYGSGSHLMGALLAYEKGWSVQFEVAGDFQALQQAVNNGSATAFLWEYFTSKPAVDAGALRWLGNYFTPWPCFVIAASEASIRTKADALQCMLKGIQASCAQVMAQPQQAQQEIVLHYGQQPADVSQWWRDVRWSTNGALSRQSLQQVLSSLRHIQSFESVSSIESLLAPWALIQENQPSTTPP